MLTTFRKMPGVLESTVLALTVRATGTDGAEAYWVERNFCVEEDRSITVSWTAFGQPDVIGMGGAYSVFDYDASQQRIVHVSRFSDEDDQIKKKLTIGPFEITSWAEPAQPNAHAAWRSWNWEAEEVRIFVTAPGGGLLGIVGNDIWPDSDPGPRYRQAFITDHLGSIVGVVHSGGNLQQRFSYDPWGHARNPETGVLLENMPARRGDRGFTGHEELRHLGLVHMTERGSAEMAPAPSASEG